MIADREQEFARLTAEAKACALCPRMINSVRVIGQASGSLDSPILIVGEAPGRLGADSSAIPFHGDKAGDNFESLIEQVGLSRHDFFITNAALCNPRDDKGNNSTPSKTELHNCSSFLKRQIDLVNPKIVVTLGAQALNAIQIIEAHDVQLSTALRKTLPWYGRKLIALYHPGQRAMIHRSFFNQLTDYQYLAEVFARTYRRTSPVSCRPSSQIVASIAQRLASVPAGISYFALHKLFYLAEHEFYRRNRRRMTSAYIVRQKEGPYVFEMHIKKLTKAVRELKTWNDRSRLMVRALPFTLFDNPISDEFDDVIQFVSNRYSKLSDSDLKRVVYLTAPMRRILRKEKSDGENMFNCPIDFSAISVV